MSDTGDERGPRIAITGAAGYVGSRVVHRFQEARPEWDLVAIDNFYRGDVRQNGDLTVDHVDVRHRDRLEEALSGADVVVHLAAVSGVEDCEASPDLAHDVNVTGTNNVAWFCRKTGAGLIFPYSMGVLGDPREFPITVEHPRAPMNWYGRTKLLNERAIEEYAPGAFRAHCFMISNAYGDHVVDDRRVSKSIVVNFFVERALSGDPLTVYEPGTQARNYVHVKDLGDAYLRSTERLLETEETGVRKYEIASQEDPSVIELAERVRSIAAEETGIDVDIELVENPRAGDETLVEEFPVDVSAAREELGWEPTRSIEETIRELIRRNSRRD